MVRQKIADSAVVGAQIHQTVEGPHGEALVAQHANALALDVHVRDQTPADGQEGVEGATLQLHPDHVHG